jgi:hypothetical protein
MRIKPSRFIVASILLHLLITVPAFSQEAIKTYDKEWKQVNEFIKKELPRSALEQVKKIYQLAKKDKQDAQVVKSLIYVTGLQHEVTENDETRSIADLEKETNTAPEPARSILNSLLAELYWQYYQQHRWQLYNRTNTGNFKKDDIATWTADDLQKDRALMISAKIHHFSANGLTAYDAIIIKRMFNT